MPSDRTPLIHSFFDEATFTVSHLVADPVTREAAVIDPVLDYDQNAGEVDTRSVDAILAKAAAEGYRIVWTLETHAHADHLSGSPLIKAKTGRRSGSASTSRMCSESSAPSSTPRT